MEYGSRLRIALFSLLGIILLVLSIWGITSITRSIFKPKKTTQTTTQQVVLSDYARGATAVKLQTGGPIVGDDKYVSYEIEVTETYRKMTTFAGYQQVPTNVKQYDNNLEAYRNFLRALERSGFLTQLKNTEGLDGTAACPTGRRFTYVLSDQKEEVSNLWSTSCTNIRGTLGGNASGIRSLFKAQINDFNAMLQTPYSVLQ